MHSEYIIEIKMLQICTFGPRYKSNARYLTMANRTFFWQLIIVVVGMPNFFSKHGKSAVFSFLSGFDMLFFGGAGFDMLAKKKTSL